MSTMKITEREFAGLRVVLCGGSDGLGGGDGPLVVLLHGFGAPGRDLVPLAQFMKVPPLTRFAFPAAPLSLGTGFDFGLGELGLSDSRAWWQIDMQRLERLMMQAGDFRGFTEDLPDGMVAARTQLTAALEAMEQALAVPSGRLVLGGFSQGSMLALDVALHSTRPLGGLLLWSGTLLCAGEWLPRMAGRRGLPVLQSHGQQDGLLPFALAARLRDELVAAGVGVEFVPFAGGHEIPPPVLQASSRFLVQVLG